MAILKLTAKRQATFPKEACETLGLKPGDTIELEPRTEDGEKVWILRPRPVHQRDWVGCLGKKATNVTNHSLETIRRSIATGRKADV